MLKAEYSFEQGNTTNGDTEIMRINSRQKQRSSFKGIVPIGAALMLSTGFCLAGSISGTVHAEGKAGADNDALCGKYDSHQFKFAERVNYSEMRDFVVYIDGLVETNAPAPEEPVRVVTRRVSQKGAMFSPHVLPVLVGTTVEWPNNDDILHNVFSFSETNPFDLACKKNPEVKRVTFQRPGRVDVYCSIHTRMSCRHGSAKSLFRAVQRSRSVHHPQRGSGNL